VIEPVVARAIESQGAREPGREGMEKVGKAQKKQGAAVRVRGIYGDLTGFDDDLIKDKQVKYDRTCTQIKSNRASYLFDLFDFLGAMVSGPRRCEATKDSGADLTETEPVGPLHLAREPIRRNQRSVLPACPTSLQATWRQRQVRAGLS
jgi:hypothetical protein